MPLKFELGDAFQFDSNEEGLVVGGIYRRLQVAHLKLCASRAFWLVAYPQPSPPVVRTFCGRCGSPLTYQHDDSPDTVDVTTATFDVSDRFAPTRESGSNTGSRGTR